MSVTAAQQSYINRLKLQAFHSGKNRTLQLNASDSVRKLTLLYINPFLKLNNLQMWTFKLFLLNILGLAWLSSVQLLRSVMSDSLWPHGLQHARPPCPSPTPGSHALEKAMATHSTVLAWRIPGTWEPGGLLSMGSHRVGHDWSDLAAAYAVYI